MDFFLRRRGYLQRRRSKGFPLCLCLLKKIQKKLSKGEYWLFLPSPWSVRISRADRQFQRPNHGRKGLMRLESCSHFRPHRPMGPNWSHSCPPPFRELREQTTSQSPTYREVKLLAKRYFTAQCLFEVLSKTRVYATGSTKWERRNSFRPSRRNLAHDKSRFLYLTWTTSLWVYHWLIDWFMTLGLCVIHGFMDLISTGNKATSPIRICIL